MNSTRKSTSRFGLAAVIAAAALATAACGSEQAPATGRTAIEQAQPAPPAQHAAVSADAAERAGRQAQSAPPSAHAPVSADAAERAGQQAAQARAEHADALRWAQGHRAASH
jgi:hypothetical protein